MRNRSKVHSSVVAPRLHGDRGRNAGLTDDGGYVLALTALLMLPLLAFTGYAVDLGAWYARAGQIQRAADASALAGARYMPNFGRAEPAAREVATKNGFTDNPAAGISVQVQAVAANPSQLKVVIQDDRVGQYFSKLFRSNVTISRPATAELIRPIPMGSPRNFLGTGDRIAASTGVRDNYWLSVSGYCARREMGDRMTPRSDANGGDSSGGVFQGCVPGVNGVVANPEYTADGYFYAIEFSGAGSGSWYTQLYDAPHCQFEGSTAGDSGAENSTSARRYTYILRDKDRPDDPTQARILYQQTVSPASCSTMAGRWVNFGPAFSGSQVSTPGTYYLQIKPVVPTSTGPGNNQQEGQNQFGLRVNNAGSTGDSFYRCSADRSVDVPGAPYSASCPQVYGLTHLGVYANLVGTRPSFFLASIEPQYNNHTLEVELFDPAEGALGIELLDPNGTPVTFTWEIACADGAYQSETGQACTTGENAPQGGYGPGTTNYKDVSGTVSNAQRTWGSRNIQNGKYSDRLLRLKYKLPADIAAAYGGNTWWKIRYTVASSGLGDRTTWSVIVKGDPVRLVPNA
ncbi:MAG: pilus assembly protein TadG-related protein [Acidimicrobiales bacterium]